MINVTRPSMPLYDEYCDEIKDLWDSCWLTNMGIKHRRLQMKLKEYLDVHYVDLTTNGHMAIELSLVTLGLKGEIITTPFTFASTTHAISRAGLVPVFCDIDPTTFTIDTSKIEELITEKTCAILPVHVYGNVCDIEGIDAIAKKYNLKIIYDAAHTFGVKYKGRGIASYGDVSCFSFHATKVFHTIEGGAVCFNDDHFGKKFYEIKDFGIHDEETVNYIGPNAKFNEFCAAMGICNLRHIDEEIKRRKKIVERYRHNLQDTTGIHLNIVQDNVDSNYSYFPIVIEKDKFGLNRDEIKERLKEKGIGTRKYFYPLTSKFECYKQNSYNTPTALKISESVLTLPLYADLSMEEVDFITNTIIDLSKGK